MDDGNLSDVYTQAAHLPVNIDAPFFADVLGQTKQSVSYIYSTSTHAAPIEFFQMLWQTHAPEKNYNDFARYVNPKHAWSSITYHYDLNKLGSDRYCASLALHHLLPESDWVNVSLGTATTVDVCIDHHFYGGWIAAGFANAMQGLAQKTALPIVLPSSLSALSVAHTPLRVPMHTQDALQHGNAYMQAGFIEKMYRMMTQEYPQKKIQLILTGGHVRDVLPYVDATLEPIYIPHLVLRGLSVYILHQNKSVF